MFPLREWGFDSPLGHHPSHRGWGNGAAIMSLPPHSPGSESPGQPGAHLPESVPLKTLIAVNLKVLLFVSVFGAAAFGLWRGIAALFPELEWLQFPG
jgi:hypothetical protein